MFKIAVCDDEKLFREKMKKYVASYLTEKQISFEIDTFRSGQELLALGIELLGYDIIFLDINMKEVDGIAAAQKIREYSMETIIVFVTAYINYSLEGYKVGAARYILKNNHNFDESVCECMDTILAKRNAMVQRKVFRFNEGEKEVSMERILYIESRLHKLEFHVMEDKWNIYTMYTTLNVLEKEMQEYGFLRIHQSFLVNLRHIKNVSGYKVILSNGQELMIPKVRYGEVKRAFVAYKGEL